MHRKSTEADRADRADGAGSEYKVLEVVKTVRICQNSLGQNGTRLGLLLLLVGPNGDGFGGQAFMEHYNAFNENFEWTLIILVVSSRASSDISMNQCHFR
jgi:hypothetical protein